MDQSAITKDNVGRIAERIVANELESRGFEVSELNRDRTARNADLLAVSHGGVWQLQVKGAANKLTEPWWVGYGNCLQAHIDSNGEGMFNRSKASHYRADVIVLVAVRSQREYRCVVLPAEAAEQAVQVNLDRDFRTPRQSGKPDPKKPGKMWVYLDHRPQRKTKDRALVNKLDGLLKQEQEILGPYLDTWEALKKRAAGIK